MDSIRYHRVGRKQNPELGAQHDFACFRFGIPARIEKNARLNLAFDQDPNPADHMQVRERHLCTEPPASRRGSADKDVSKVLLAKSSS